MEDTTEEQRKTHDEDLGEIWELHYLDKTLVE